MPYADLLSRGPVRVYDLLVHGVTKGLVTASRPVLAGANGEADLRQPVTEYAANGALTIANGTHNITKSASAGVMTLAAPSAGEEGIRMLITTETAQAHTVTVTAGFNGAGSGADVATFGGAIGDCMEIIAINGKWNVISLRNVTLG